MSNMINILGMAGSLREKSFNRALLREATQLTPENAEIEIFELDGIPPYNQDKEENTPEVITGIKQEVSNADAVLFIAAEYNCTVPGMLKNAIDGASRLYGDNSFEGKPAHHGLSVSMPGSARVQYHLLQMCVYLDMYPVNQPEVMVPNAMENVDEDGNFTEETSKDLVRDLCKTWWGGPKL